MISSFCRKKIANVFYNARLFTTKRESKTHYEILNVQKNCTQKDIKDSYIKLSKKYHPDRNKDAEAQARFVKVVQAYNVLSKPHLRQVYDLDLSNHKRNIVYYSPGDEHTVNNPWDNPIFYKNRDKSKDRYYEGQSYYGIKGIKKVSNMSIVFMCFVVATVAVTLQLLAIRYSFTLRRDLMRKRSEENGTVLKEVQLHAAENGNKVQLEILKAKLIRAGVLTEFSDEDDD